MIPMYRNSSEMAKVLVQYMDDARAVQRFVRERFQDCPSLHTIKDMRLVWLRKKGKHLQRTNAWDKMSRDGKAGCTGAGEQLAFEKMLAEGSDALRRALIREHAPILRALDDGGNCAKVVWL